jgi:hypothetical protein
MPETPHHNHMLRHLLKTIHYRMQGVLKGVPSQFAVYSVGNAARSPAEILSHVADVLSWSIEQVAPGSFTAKSGGSWPDQVRRYQAALDVLDRALTTEAVSEVMAERLTQGPLADVLTHVGQLAMLRGLAGEPVPGQQFFDVKLPDIVQDVGGQGGG